MIRIENLNDENIKYFKKKREEVLGLNLKN